MKIAPSILAADFSKLADEIKEVELGGADYIHIDIMDGHFVPNITMGPMIVEAVKKVTSLPLDVHLMIKNPEQYVKAFADAGADFITVHIEADPHIHRTLQEIRRLGAKPGIVLNPGTPASMITSVLEEVDMILLMTVNPGFGGQSFIDAVLPKIREVKEMVELKQLNVDIEVDGGINSETANKCKDAGANVFVAGSAIFNNQDRQAAIEEIRSQLSK
ncbi:ribulose-phosphate 3-epimerase [Lederbergia citrea]|uniref:Ribulose-phosphate 3-epimerase n=1 Tax=Lederbergia citrea TaxID=2833581 RepID=A0A942UJ28_9BACI|nr:ribulose-phosphate 3-epimerase [Lederbergia citrea]MBS4177167.1 ribulose-phosphate 3-epimerase [Lederbergia citrea]MBS4221585.1 ribulose-phosphate 3-epimerase [Lederbergia citrea]